MAASEYFNTVQKLFIAFYQRPADPGGLLYWSQRLDGAQGSLVNVINAFAESKESKDLYGQINSDNIGNVVDAIYQALFNRPAEATGKKFYVDGFKAGTFTPGSIALDVLNGASGSDLVAIQNKVTVANRFTEAVDGRPLTNADFGTGTNFAATYNAADEQNARDWLAEVTSDPTTIKTATQVKADVALNIADPGDPIYKAPGEAAFTITANTASVTEDGTVTFTLTAKTAVTVATDVVFSLIAGSTSAQNQGTGTTNLNDFAQGAFNPVTVTIPAGGNKATFVVKPLNDNLSELPETFSVQAVVAGETFTATAVTVFDGVAANAPTFTLQEALVAEVLPAVYNINPSTAAKFDAGIVSVAAATSAYAAVTAVLSGAANTGDLVLENLFKWTIQDTVANVKAANAAVLNGASSYILRDTLDNLKADGVVRQGASSYLLTETSFKAADIISSTVSELSGKQAAARAVLTQDTVLTGAANYSVSMIKDGAYTLSDSLQNLKAAAPTILSGGKYFLNEVNLTAAPVVDSTVSQLTANQLAAKNLLLNDSVLKGAQNADQVTVANGTYTLKDTFANLKAPASADELASAKSWSLSDTQIVAANVVDTTVANLGTARDAAKAVITNDPVYAGAENTVPVVNGTYTLKDTLAILTANSGVRGAATSYSLSDTTDLDPTTPLIDLGHLNAAQFEVAQGAANKADYVYTGPAVSYTVVPAATSVMEGASIAFTVKAFDANGKETIVDAATSFDIQIQGVTVQDVAGPAGLADFIDASEINVTLAKDTSSATFTLQVKDDGVLEGFEAFRVGLSKNLQPISTSATVKIADGSQTFDLTTAQNIFAGTSRGDTFNAAPVGFQSQDATTLQSWDSIDGGSGTDTLNIYVKSTSGDAGTAYNAEQVGTVKNVEIINIYNTEAKGDKFGQAAGGIDASKFQGAEQVWQIDGAVNVTKLAATTTAGFRNTGDGVTVSAAAAVANIALDGAKSTTEGSGVTINVDGVANIALDDAKTKTEDSGVTINVDGAALNTVNISGTVAGGAQGDLGLFGGPRAGEPLKLKVTAGSGVTTLSVKSAVDVVTFLMGEDVNDSVTTLNLDLAGTTFVNVEGSGGTGGLAKLTTINAAPSTGDILLKLGGNGSGSGKTLLHTITTGSGDDFVRLNAEMTATSKIVSVTTGNGNDVLALEIYRGAVTGTSLRVDAGNGDDIIDIAANGLTLTANDSINGGSGADTVYIAGAPSRIENDLSILRNVITNVETLAFVNGEGASGSGLDAAGLNHAFGTLAFVQQASGSGENFVKNVTTETITAVDGASLDVTAKNYVAGSGATPPVFGGDLNVVVSADKFDTAAWELPRAVVSSQITAKGEDLTLSVIAKNSVETGRAATESTVPISALLAATLTGDVKTANITLTGGVNAAEPAGAADSINAAMVKLSATASEPTQSADLTSLTTVTLGGNGVAMVENGAGSKLATINASALNSTIDAPYVFNPSDATTLFTGTDLESRSGAISGIFGNDHTYNVGDKSFGLILTSGNSAVKETVTLGNAVDIILSADGSFFGIDGDKMDVINGLNLVLKAGSTTELSNQSDVLFVTPPETGSGTTFVKLDPTTISYTGTNLSLYLTEVAKSESNNLVFQFQDNTYVYVDRTTAGVLDATDVVVQLTGLVNLDALVASLNLPTTPI